MLRHMRDFTGLPFRAVRDQGRLDLAAVDASIARAEWRPSLPMLHEVLDEFR